MNLNQRIDGIHADGIPTYNRKINEIIAAVNWLLGVRVTNGRPVRGEGGGPVFDLSPAAAQGGNQPWATDPDGNPAGWSLITCLDLETNESYDTWIWTGQQDTNVLPIPWTQDPSGNQAGWIVCTDNSFWGTGQCSTGEYCTNFQTASTVNSPQWGNPQTATSNPQTIPITPPSSCTPRFYLGAGPRNPNDQKAPYLEISNGLTTGDPSSAPFSFIYTATYDGLTVLSFSGSGTAIFGKVNYVALPTAGWVFDPESYPGYTQGDLYWIYPFNGAASPNTNPTVIQTFSYTFTKAMQADLFGVTLMTG